jgi:phage gp46-like protein
MACGMNSSAERAVIRSWDGGATWYDAISGLPGSSATQVVSGIHVISNTEAYCYCPSSVPGSDGIYIWNGSTWTFYFGAYGTSRILKSDDGYIYLLRGSTFSRWNGTLYDDASLPGGTFYVDFCIDSNGVIYVFEYDGGFWSNSKVYRGTFNSLSLDRSPTDYHHPSKQGFPVAWVGSDNTIYYVARKELGGYGNLNQYVSKRDPNTGTWSDIYLFHSTDWHETAVRAIAGSSDSDIFVLAGLTYWWNDGKGYNYKYNGVSWSLEQDYYYTRVGSQMQLSGLFVSDTDITPEKRKTMKKNGESYCRKISSGDITYDDYGAIDRDYSPESRCTFRLLCRRGQYWVDPTLGSRLYTIKTLKDAKRKVAAYVDEALKPLVSEGTILGASIGEYYEDPVNGMLAVQIMINIPSATQPVDLGLIPLGRL